MAWEQTSARFMQKSLYCRRKGGGLGVLCCLGKEMDLLTVLSCFQPVYIFDILCLDIE